MSMSFCIYILCILFFNDTATTEIYTYRHTLSLHDALPICRSSDDDDQPARRFRGRRHRARRQPGRLGHPQRPRRQRTDGKVVEGEGEKRKEGGMTNRGRNFMMPSFNAILLAGAAAMLPLGAPAHAAPEEAPTAEIVHPHDDSVIDVDSEAYAEEQKEIGRAHV